MSAPAGYVLAGALQGGTWAGVHKRRDGKLVTKSDIDTQRALRKIDVKIITDGKRSLYYFKRNR